jgi:hypothetical protein
MSNEDEDLPEPQAGSSVMSRDEVQLILTHRARGRELGRNEGAAIAFGLMGMADGLEFAGKTQKTNGE